VLSPKNAEERRKEGVTRVELERITKAHLSTPARRWKSTVSLALELAMP